MTAKKLQESRKPTKGLTKKRQLLISALLMMPALGFFGVSTSGMHHQAHQGAMATGSNPPR
jgi:hypothetical protein